MLLFSVEDNLYHRMFSPALFLVLANLDQADNMEFSKLVTAEEVSRHNTPTDLWIVVEDTVWDVSSFAPEHPGGVACESLQATSLVQIDLTHTVACSDTKVCRPRRNQSVPGIPQPDRG